MIEADCETTFTSLKDDEIQQTDKQSDSSKISEAEKIEHPSDVIGGWGPSQKRIVFYLIMMYTVAPFSNSHIVYSAPSVKTVDFFCIGIDALTNRTIRLKNTCNVGNYSCQEFEHDTSFHKKNLVNTFDLVCDKAWLPSLSQSVHQAGYAVSGLLLGHLSDRKGRFFCAKVAIIIEICAGLVQAFSPDIHVYLIARFFIGIGSDGRFLNGYILLSEWVGPTMRGKLASAVYEVGNQVGGLLLLGSFYFVGDYFRIEMTVRIVEIVLFIGYIFTVKESPRWLITHGKWKEAERLLKSVAMEKGVHSEKEIERRIIRLRQWTMKQQSEEERKKKQSIFDIWREPKLLKTSLILYFSFFALEFISQATLLNVGQLGGSVYAIQLFGKILAFPSVALVYYVMPRVERRRLGRSCLLIMTVCLLLSLGCTLFPSFLLYPLVLFSRIYKTSGGMTMKTLYVLSTEIFPTNMRQTSVGVCSLFARFGSVIAPFVKELTIATYLWIPFAIYTILTVTTAFLWIFLPNTFDVHLPDNIKQSTRLENECEKTQNDETH